MDEGFGAVVERCACCGRPLSPVARYGDWCHGCLDGVLRDARLLRGDPDMREVCEWLTERGCLTLSRYVIGRIPFCDD